ncbi:T9SS type A sorting domain-containing protein [Flavobacterium sp.]|uniref:RCC1 domain-containing protein n=1 Tax=Flavobacterium sp. TaxID=239 RepID=UPI0026285235|nr:T9SS type A sorting domain-containing protein [Flavobacterium sp.]
MKKKITLLLSLIAFQMNAQCWQTFSSGSTHSLAVLSNGTLWAWGSNASGQLGDGTTTNVALPIQIGTETDWRYVFSGFSSSFAIKTNGTLWVWGSNTNGRLGTGNTTNLSVPTQVGTDTNWLYIDSKSHTVGVKTDGTLWTWGYNSLGQLGDGTNTNQYAPILIGSGWSSVTVGANSTNGIKSNGTLWAWGQNNYGQYGNNTTAESRIPIQIGTATDWSKIASGNNPHILATKTNGTLWAWGRNSGGQMGNGTNIDSKIPVQIGSNTNWSVIAAGQSHSIGIQTNGTLWGWGVNGFGSVGDNTTTSRNAPVQIGIETDWSFSSFTGSTSFALKTDGRLLAWGSNSYGEIGDGTTGSANNRLKPVTITCPIALSTEDFSPTTFSMYPNPTSDFLNIKNDMNLSIDTISIMDLTGKKMLEQKGTNSPVNVQPLANGIYMIQITSEGRSFQNKFIKS